MKEKARIFQENRMELLNIAYGMLGSLSDAKDIVQEGFIRWSKVDLSKVNTPGSYLRAIISRLCIDHFRSAKNKREEYIGPWLPEPVTDENLHSPDQSIELHHELSIALLHLLENLSPDQRAIYLLHDVFGYKFSEIGGLVDKSSAACRKAAQRARKHIQNSSLPQSPASGESQETIHAFIEALRLRDMKKLQSILTEEIVMYSDGGGKANAARKPVEGINKVIRFLIKVTEKNKDHISVEETAVNNRPGFKAFMDGKLHSIWSFKVKQGKIERVFAVLNPIKLPVNQA